MNVLQSRNAQRLNTDRCGGVEEGKRENHKKEVKLTYGSAEKGTQIK